MSVAIRTATRIQDQDDFGSVPGAGNDGYALTWDNGAGEFVLAAAGVTDHGALTGLADDDHAGYALLAGRAGGQTIYGGNAANDDITIHGTSNATRTTSYVLLQPSGGNVGIGTSAPARPLDVAGDAQIGSNLANYFRMSGQASGSAPFLETVGTVDAAVDFQIKPYGSGRVSVQRSLLVWGNAIASGDYVRLDGGTPPTISVAGSSTNISLILTPKGTGGVGIGTTAPATLLHGLLTSAATNAVTNVLTIGHDTTGTAAAGFGAGQLFQLESSTTAAQNAGRIQALWYEATHATRKADLVLTAYDTAEREGLRIRGAGSAAAIGFLGAAPAARIAHVADPSGGATVDAEARSAINLILATLETFGLHATS